MISGLNQPKRDSIRPAEPIVLQGCSHYNTSKNRKSKCRLNLRNSIRTCFHFKFLPTQFTRLPYILPWLIPNFSQSFVPSVSGKDFRLKSNPQKKNPKNQLLLMFLILPIPLAQFRWETGEFVAMREQQTLVGEGNQCLRGEKLPLTQLCC